jgi:hypothetical protein
MKIYVDQEKPSSPPSSILALAKNNKNHNKVNKILERLERLEKYTISKESIVHVYSKEGIYQVNENQIYKLYVNSEKIHENIVLKTHDDDDDKQITLVIDDSVIEKELVHQIPYDHINIPLTTHIYSLNKNNKNNNYNKLGLTLVIEFIQNDKENIKPINYYFECASEIGYNNLPIEDINVFLSLLN